MWLLKWKAPIANMEILFRYLRSHGSFQPKYRVKIICILLILHVWHFVRGHKRASTVQYALCCSRLHKQYRCTSRHSTVVNSMLTTYTRLIIKPNRSTNFSNLFWNRTPHGLDSSSVDHQESSTLHAAIHTGYADSLLASSQRNLYDIYHCCVYCAGLLIMDRDTVRNM